MSTISPIYLLAVMLTATVLYLTRGAPTTGILAKAGRILMQSIVVGLGIFLAAMVSQSLGMYSLLTNHVYRDLVLMTLVAYCFVYRGRRHWLSSVRQFVSSCMLLAVMLAACVVIWHLAGGTLVSAVLIPWQLPLMRWVEGRVLEAQRSAGGASRRKKGAMHYRSADFEISYVEGDDKLQLKCTLPAHASRGTPETAFQGSIAALHHASGLAMGSRWGPNVQCSWEEETETRYSDNSSTQYIPGTTATGFSSSGETITVHTPGTSVYIPATKHFSYESKTGLHTATVFIVIDDMGYHVVLPKMKTRDKAALDEVVTAIRTALAERCAQSNTREVADAEAQRIEKAAAAQQAAQDAKEAARLACVALLERAGLRRTEGDLFLHYDYDATGALTRLIAADRDGHGLLLSGSDVWMGSWKNAELVQRKAERELHFKVVDEAYRQQHLKERRLVVRGWSDPLCTEWQDRIALLNAG